MSKKQFLSSFYIYVLTVFTYVFAAFANIFAIEQYLIEIGTVNCQELDNITIYKISGCFIGSLLFLISARFLVLKDAVITALTVYLIGVLNVIFLSLSGGLIHFYSLLYSAATIFIISALIIYPLNDSKITKQKAVSVFSVILLIAYSMAGLMVDYIADKNVDVHDIIEMRQLIILTVIPFAFFAVFFIISEYFNYKPEKSRANFIAVIKNMDIELITILTTSCTVMIIAGNYELQAITHPLFLLSLNKAKYYIFGVISTAMLILPILIMKFNKHKTNLVSISAMLVLFLLMPLWGNSEIISLVLWAIIALLIYIVFLCILLILTKKFDKINLLLALSGLSVAISLGFYFGYVLVDEIAHIIGDNSFLVSICFVEALLLSYYLIFFKVRKLYR